MNYTEIHKLHRLLKNAGIPHVFQPFWDGWQVIYPSDDDRVGDAVEHQGSYGHAIDRLEVLGNALLPEEFQNSVEGGLTADEVFQRIIKYHVRRGRK